MKIKTKVMAFLFVLFGAFAFGCGAPQCAELDEVCNQCEDDFVKETCQALVDENNNEDCEAGIPAFELVCP